MERTCENLEAGLSCCGGLGTTALGSYRGSQACSPPGVVALPPMKWSRAPISLVPVADRRAVRSGDNVVQVVGWLIGWLQTILNAPLYLWQAWIAAKFNRSRPWLYFNYIYQLEWVILVAVFVCLWSPRHWIVATIVDSHKRREDAQRGAIITAISPDGASKLLHGRLRHPGVHARAQRASEGRAPKSTRLPRA